MAVAKKEDKFHFFSTGTKTVVNTL